MAFRSQLKIRFGDIDRAGIVYYPRFMHYFHVALEEFFASELGIGYHVVVETPPNRLAHRSSGDGFQPPVQLWGQYRGGSLRT